MSYIKNTDMNKYKQKQVCKTVSRLNLSTKAASVGSGPSIGPSFADFALGYSRLPTFII